MKKEVEEEEEERRLQQPAFKHCAEDLPDIDLRGYFQVEPPSKTKQRGKKRSLLLLVPYRLPVD